MTAELEYTPDGRPIYRVEGANLEAFFLSRAFVQGIQGPVGSAKSKTANLKIWKFSTEQKPARDGVRYTRWGVVRNTYPELRTTTIRTWTDTFPEKLYGPIIWSMPARQLIRMGDVHCEIDFLALDKDEDVKKLRSGEYTGFYANELQYQPKSIFDEMTSRAGRYPAIKDGGPSWKGVIFDMNAPDEDHFIAMMTGQTEWPENMPQDERAALAWPADWDFFMQPPGLVEVRGPDGSYSYVPNPKAENLKWLPDGYYLDQIKGKTRAWIKSRIMNEIALVVDGAPVYPNFRQDYHVAREALKPVPNHDVLIGIDPGRWPAAIFAQEVNGRIFFQYELLGFNEAATTFAPKVKKFLDTHYPNCEYAAWGDPKGFDKGQARDDCAYDIFAEHGIVVRAPPGLKQNNIETRTNAFAHILDDNPAGVPRFVLSPLCRTTKIGLAGRYCLEKDETGELKPTKNRYSHPCNAGEYLLLGAGEGRRMIGRPPISAITPIRISSPRRSRRRVSA